MRVFVYESITGGGLAGEPMPSGLAREGGLMLDALARDLAEVAGVELIMTRDERLPAPDQEAQIVWIREADEPDRAFVRALDWAEAAWPIAPETKGELEALSEAITRAGKKLLGCPVDAVALCASKLKTAARLEACGVPAVTTKALSDMPAASGGRWVIKPDDGVGCLGTRIVDRIEHGQLDGGDKLIAQPYVEGIAASLGLLCGGGEARLLSVNGQRIVEEKGGFRLAGCVVNAISDDDGIYSKLGARIARAIPELWGYVGADIMITPEGPVVLEINPRITTSCVGLRAARGINLARLVLDLMGSGAVPEPAFLQGRPIEVQLDDGPG